MRMYACVLFVLTGASLASGADTAESAGAGSYSTVLPPGAAGPQAEIFKTVGVKGKMPTNDWWSSLAWLRFSERQYPHPLAVEARPAGLRVHYPGPSITANRDAIFGFMPADT